MRTINVSYCIFSSSCDSSILPVFCCVLLLIIASIFEHASIDVLFWKKPWSSSRGILESPPETCLSSSVFMLSHWISKTNHSSALPDVGLHSSWWGFKLRGRCPWWTSAAVIVELWCSLIGMMMIHLHVTFWPTDLNVIISAAEASCRL